MPKSDEDLLMLSRIEMEKYVGMGHFQDPHTALPYLVEGHQFGYRLAESEKDSKYEKLVEGLRKMRRWQSGIGNHQMRSHDDGDWIMRYDIESLITKIEGGDNDTAIRQA